MATATTTVKKTTAKKTTTTKTTTAAKKKTTASASTTKAAKTTTATTKTSTKKTTPCANTFPREELLSWLSTHSYWNHGDWENLIQNLKTQGYNDYINTNGVNDIGLFLETNRH